MEFSSDGSFTAQSKDLHPAPRVTRSFEVAQQRSPSSEDLGRPQGGYGQLVDLVTRASANSLDLHASHRSPELPTAPTLEPHASLEKIRSGSDSDDLNSDSQLEQ